MQQFVALCPALLFTLSHYALSVNIKHVPTSLVGVNPPCRVNYSTDRFGSVLPCGHCRTGGFFNNPLTVESRRWPARVPPRPESVLSCLGLTLPPDTVSEVRLVSPRRWLWTWGKVKHTVSSLLFLGDRLQRVVLLCISQERNNKFAPPTDDSMIFPGGVLPAGFSPLSLEAEVSSVATLRWLKTVQTSGATFDHKIVLECHHTRRGWVESMAKKKGVFGSGELKENFLAKKSCKCFQCDSSVLYNIGQSVNTV